ncbi:MAG: 5-formyltetrahydrofolate cyclo-ligase [Corynebacterium sp.]|nr:5-formyltetrahydrofolate cyclo-ligase [Corynebacterium sp.]
MNTPDSQPKSAHRHIIRALRRPQRYSPRHAFLARCWVHSLGLPTGARVACFAPIPGEPTFNAPRPLFNLLIDDSYHALLPKIHGDELRFGTAPLTAGKFNIPEPTEAPYTWKDLDAIIIPALAVDFAGHRLGQGGGFYDKTWARAGKPQIPTAALIWESEFRPIAYEEHDMKATAVITERRIYPLPWMPTSG